jgi:YesN/AraC family two-component response regulator
VRQPEVLFTVWFSQTRKQEDTCITGVFKIQSEITTVTHNHYLEMIALKIDEQRELSRARKKLYVKYMVSLRCEGIVKAELGKLGIRHKVSDHAIVFYEDVALVRLDALKKNLEKAGIELLDEDDSMLIDRITTSVNEVIHASERLPNISYDEIINKEIALGSDYVLKIFSDVMGVSILHYIVMQKIEKVKELLLYSDFTLPEIANSLRYKNENLLVAQFKKFTGLSPFFFQEIKRNRNRNRSCA